MVSDQGRMRLISTEKVPMKVVHLWGWWGVWGGGERGGFGWEFGKAKFEMAQKGVFLITRYRKY